MKNLTIYKSEKGWKPNFELLRNNLSIPGKIGFGWQLMRDDNPVITVGSNHLIVCEKQEKLLPASVINQELKIRIAQIETEQGYKVGKKMKRDLKEQITEELYVKAFTVSKFYNVWINTDHDLMCIETTSESVADNVMSQLIKDLDWRGNRFVTNRPADFLMRQLILSDDSSVGNFSLGASCVLQDRDENGKKITYENESLNSGVVSNYVMEGKKPVKLEVMIDGGECIFTIDNNYVISKITLPDIVENRSDFDTDDDYFDNQFAISAGQCIGIINALIETLDSEESESQEEVA